MGRSAQAYGAKAKISLFAILVCLAGCSSSNLEPSFTTVVVEGEPGDPLPFNIKTPCGVMDVREPLVNITGYVPGSAAKERFVYLFLAPQTSFPQVLEAFQGCPPIEKRLVEEGGSFSFPYYPVGNYFIMASTDWSKGEFPVVYERVESDLRVKVVSHVMAKDYGITVFSVQSVSGDTE